MSMEELARYTLYPADRRFPLAILKQPPEGLHIQPPFEIFPPELFSFLIEDLS